MLWRCEILYSFGDREPLVTFWLQGTLGCTASHRGYVLAKTEIVLLLFFGFVVGFPRFTVSYCTFESVAPSGRDDVLRLLRRIPSKLG